LLVECVIAARSLGESRPGDDGAESDESDKRFHGSFSYFEMVSGVASHVSFGPMASVQLTQ
jgi:hypothetical protein